jgi:signal transduction histidine kinase
MNKLADKLIVLVLCMACYLQYATDYYIVVPIICAVTASALCSYLEKDTVITAVFIVYCAACVAFPIFLFFLPLLCYDVIQIRRRYIGFAAILPVAVGFENLPVITSIFVVLFIAIACLFRLRTASLEKVRSDYIRLRDTTKEFSLQLENKNKELMDKQDYEINLATLGERNRIARDMHDSIGHLLSNSILQTGALMATCTDDAFRGRLETLKSTLTQGMDSVRESIHDLHDDSVDLYSEVKALADTFHFCAISLEYGIEGNPDRKIKYALLAIVKEALSNVIRHSNATYVRIILREHPALYQLTVRDDGTKKELLGEGIGLKNIEQRVNSLNGIVTINRDSGFTVFASIPKGGKL